MATQVYELPQQLSPDQTLDMTNEKKKLLVAARYNAHHAADDWADATALAAKPAMPETAAFDTAGLIEPAPAGTAEALHPQIALWARTPDQREGVQRLRPVKAITLPQLVLFDADGLPAQRWLLAKSPYIIGTTHDSDFTLPPDSASTIKIELHRADDGMFILPASGTLYRKIPPAPQRIEVGQQFAVGIHRLRVLSTGEPRRAWWQFTRGTHLQLRLEATNLLNRQVVARDITTDGVIVIGADPACDLHLQNDPFASPIHAELAINVAAKALELTDQKSFNATYLAIAGKTPIQSADLFLLRSLLFGIVW